MSGRDRACLLLATVGGLGLAPFMPGTFGAIGGAVIYVAIAFSLPDPTPQLIAIAAALAASCVISVLLGPWSERYWGRKDAQSFVLDEVAGLLLTILIFRAFYQPSPWITLAWTFPVTRVFDIVKLPPARQLEKLPHGWGILMDDLMSSVYAGAAVCLAAWLWPAGFGM